VAYSAKAVANYLLGRAWRERRKLDPMQIQKLVYYAHGWHLALRDQPLINEPVEAWPFGPVIADLFHEFKQWGSQPIEEAAKVRGHGLTRFGSHDANMDQEAIHDADLVEAKRIINRVWDVYGAFGGVQLSNMTHQPDSPWAEVRRANPGARDVVIPNETLKRYFEQRVQRNVSANAAG
jgi:uncharacterized phage-associated protein